MAMALERAVSRAERRMASHLVHAETGKPLSRPGTNRSPASDPGAIKGRTPTYERHQVDQRQTKLMEHWTQKLVGGQAEGERILFPDRFYGKPQQAQIQVIDPDAAAGGRSPASRRPLSKAEEAEKKRIIEELTKIREN
jgi:hypothetical protein